MSHFPSTIEHLEVFNSILDDKQRSSIRKHENDGANSESVLSYGDILSLRITNYLNVTSLEKSPPPLSKTSIHFNISTCHHSFMTSHYDIQFSTWRTTSEKLYIICTK